MTEFPALASTLVCCVYICVQCIQGIWDPPPTLTKNESDSVPKLHQ